MSTDLPLIPSSLNVDGALVTFESIACNNCGSLEEIHLFDGVDRYLQLPGTFRLVRCGGCGVIRQNPRPTPDSMAAYYPASYEPYSLGIDVEGQALRRFDRRYGMIKRRRFIERFQPSGRLADIGCATGNFLAEMNHGGQWKVVGVEPNEPAAAYAQQHFGLDVRVGQITEADLSDAVFEVITLWNVLEHLHDPVDDLVRLTKHLAPGGFLIFSIPNLESFELRLFGDRWFGWELPRHLYFFPMRSLAQTLDRLGLEIIDTACLSGAHFSFTSSIKHWYTKAESAPSWHRLLGRVIDTLPARAFFAPTFSALSRLRQGMIRTVVARKRP